MHFFWKNVRTHSNNKKKEFCIVNACHIVFEDENIKEDENYLDCDVVLDI